MRQNVVSNYDCEICSDKAGYFSYIPALFYYDFRASNFPENEDQKRGNGFHLDLENDKVITKFTSGVALLQLPFYFLGYGIDSLFDLGNDPFSKYYLVWMSIGSSFYMVLGLFFLQSALTHLFKPDIAIFTTLLTLLATNLIYYVLDENLMSHLYSFSFASISLYLSIRFFRHLQPKNFILFGLITVMLILLRPTNIFISLFALTIGWLHQPQAWADITSRLKLKHLLTLSLIGILIILPQVIYWRYAYKSIAPWTYKNEGFTNALTPQFLEVWFSPQGGLFPYSPILILSLVGAVLMIRKQIKSGWVVLLTFFTISYICAAWHTPFFGECNFGKRPFVEFLPLLMIPIAYLLQQITFHNKYKNQIYTLSVVFVILNLTLFGVFDTCFYGEIWGWKEFGHLVFKGLFLVD